MPGGNITASFCLPLPDLWRASHVLTTIASVTTKHNATLKQTEIRRTNIHDKSVTSRSSTDQLLKFLCSALSHLPVILFTPTQTIQLYEMIVVRHGLMTVGQPFSGKSCALKVLSGALTELCEAGIQGTLFNRVTMRIINPKAVTMGQLYGEWGVTGKDGVMIRTPDQPAVTMLAVR